MTTKSSSMKTSLALFKTNNSIWSIAKFYPLCIIVPLIAFLGHGTIAGLFTYLSFKLKQHQFDTEFKSSCDTVSQFLKYLSITSSIIGQSFVHRLNTTHFQEDAQFFHDMSKLFGNVSRIFFYKSQDAQLTFPDDDPSITQFASAFDGSPFEGTRETFTVQEYGSSRGLMMMLVYGTLKRGGVLINGIVINQLVVDWLTWVMSRYSFQYTMLLNWNGSSTSVIRTSHYHEPMANECALLENSDFLVLKGHTYLAKDVAPMLPLIIIFGVSCFVTTYLLHLLIVQRFLYHSLVQQFIPKHLIKDVLRGKKVKQRYEHVNILFSDIVSFTTLSQQVDGEDLAIMLDELYMRFDELAVEHQVYKTDIIGDAFMCMTNCPYIEPTHESVKRIVDFAFKMMEVTQYIKMPPGAKMPLNIRVGIHTGNVVSCIMGHRVPHFFPFGEAVNYASRMESHGLPGEIHVSEQTGRILEQHYSHTYILVPRLEIPVKGYGTHNTFIVKLRSQNIVPEVV